METKKKVFFCLSSLRAGGAERVFWLLAQHFDKSRFVVYLVILDSKNAFFSLDLDAVRVVDLKSGKSSRSFLPLFRLIKKEKPDAIFTTGGQLNILLSFLSFFVKIPLLIGRENNLLDVFVKFRGFKSRFWDAFTEVSYKRLNIGVCQSAEIKSSLIHKYHIVDKKLIVIPNPVLENNILKIDKVTQSKKLIVVARFSQEKGLERLIDIFSRLPANYSLSIIGSGALKESIQEKINILNLSDRIKLLGQKSNVLSLIANYDLLLLASFTEGFPNVAVEALSVGVPVVSFKVSGISNIIVPGFNGYIIDQDDESTFAKMIQEACQQNWNYSEIKADVLKRFNINTIVKKYQSLVD